MIVMESGWRKNVGVNDSIDHGLGGEMEDRNIEDTNMRRGFDSNLAASTSSCVATGLDSRVNSMSI